tara:strand:+ start:179 stop:421 length:243 start_codon:yes stop_codon:yes gene_type:complete
MMELLGGIVLSLLLALYIVFKAWQREAEKRTEAEEKVLAHEALQKIDEDIANGGDDYITDQLREITRPVRSNSASDDIGA